MDSYPARPRRLRRDATILVVTGLLAFDLAMAPPTDAAAPGEEDRSAIVAEFNQICSELIEARSRLGSGAMSDEAFGDLVLDLFVRADSLAHQLPAGGWIQGSRSSQTFGLSRALRYLVGALRENYVGIAARDGVHFIAADRAYQAAVAWRSGIEVATASATR